MSLLRKLFKKRGFTLIELLVVIAIIAILAAILTPAIQLARFRGILTGMMSNGRGLNILLFAQETANPLGLVTLQTVGWPTAGEWDDSTDFFATLVTNKDFGVTYAFFAGPGISPAKDEAEFKDAKLRNAWCIAESVTDTMPSEAPVLFTQNVDLGNNQRIDQFDSLNAGELPFNDKACIVVDRGGRAFYLDKNTAIATNFNRTTATNTVLYPKNGQY